MTREIGRRFPQLPAATVRPVDSLRAASVPSGDKRNLVDLILREAGAAVLLSIGQGLRDDEFDPLWRTAARACSPEQLSHGWRRLEGYAHSSNRMAMEFVGPNKIVCRRYAVKGAAAPSPAENFLICGIFVALLEKIGCHDLVCTMSRQRDRAVNVYEAGHFETPEQDGGSLDTTHWTIEWSSFVATNDDARARLPEFPLPVPVDCSANSRRTVERAVACLTADFLRQWKVGELAGELGMSPRSLQRRLGEAGLGFSTLIRALRIQEACRLLEAEDHALGVIGFCAGFSDSAHFSRDFRAATGASPTAFRAALNDL